MGLGAAADVSLAQAREKATAARQLVMAGQDPNIMSKWSAGA
jgi:hypothetical protein